MTERAQVITPQAEDFPLWYQDVIAKAELAENGPVRGTMVVRPYGYAIWERMQAEMDVRIKEAGAQNAYFPLLIPQSYLNREAEHVEGFSPELAVVTHAGGKPLEEPVVIRPTSETVVGAYMAKWIRSYRDLPLLLNQWGNVMRWELRPRLFLRTSEFLWQEGHSAHATESEAHEHAVRMLRDVYEEYMMNVLAIPVMTGRKTSTERFAGAVNTMTCEAMTRDGKALQMGTSHELGTNFADAFDIRFLSEDGAHETAWTTSWGSSTRMVGGLIMVHGDDAGLRIPPAVAPVQVVVLAIKGEILEIANKIAADVRQAGHRAAVDDRVHIPFGRRVIEWELKGVPVRIELGPRDVAQDVAQVADRVTGEKDQIPLTVVKSRVSEMLPASQRVLLDQARTMRDDNIIEVSTIADAASAAAHGWAKIPWDRVGPDGEAELATHAVTVRCLQRANGSIPESDNEPGVVALVARAY